MRRKVSGGGGGEMKSPRSRKNSGDAVHRRVDSRADDGDDEGYDELLSAYESEAGSGDGVKERAGTVAVA